MADAVLVLALLAPLGAIVVALGLEMPALALARPMLLAAAAAITALLVAGSAPVAGPFEPDPLALAAAAGVLLLAATVLTAADATAPAGAAVVVAAAVLMAPTPGTTLVGALVGLALLAPLRGGWSSAAGAAGLTIAAASTVLDQHAPAQLAVLGVGLGTAAIAVSARRGGTSVLVLPAVLVVGLRALPTVVDTSVRARNTAAIVLAAAGLAVIALPALPALRRRGWWANGAATAVAPFALAAALGPVPGVASAAGLLSAGSVLAAALPAGLDTLAATPGAVALGDALVDGRGTTAAVVGALAAAAAVLLLGQRPRVARPGSAQLMAVGLTIWLVLRPSSWSWARPPDLDRYTDGLAIAVAAGLVTVVAAVAGGVAQLPALARPVEAPPSHRSSRDRAAALAVTAALGCVAGALVRSGAL
jgi:hypothetical protein